jgi:hypothetical protein
MDNLNISLITVMAYNEGFILNLKEMFDSLKVPTIRNPPTTRKGKEIDIKSIKVKAGTIITAKFGNFIKGLDRVPSGRYKFYVNGEEYEDTYDNIEKYHNMGEITQMEKLDNKVCDTCKINVARYGQVKAKKAAYCQECANDLHWKVDDIDLVEIVAKKSFPHQITINYAYKEGMNINMFLFRKNIKISGFQSEKYSIRMIKKFWKKHLIKAPEAINFFTDDDPGYIFESSMTNSSFETNYNFMLTKVNTLIHKLKQDDSMILNTDFEPTIDTGIKITLKATKPSDYSFQKITWLRDSEMWEDSIVFEILGRNKSTELDNKKTTVYLYDERFMISTRYGVVLKPACKFLTDILEEHRKELEIYKVDKIVKYSPVFV